MEEVYVHADRPVKQTNWIMLSLIFGVVIVLVIIGIFVYFNKNKQIITFNQQDLLAGKDFNIKQGEIINFNINDSEKHSLTVDSISADSVTISIQSEKTTLTLKIGEEKNVDINKDGIEDIVVKLVSIENGKPLFNIKKITLENNQIINSNNPQTCSEKGGNLCIIPDCEGEIVNSSEGSNCCIGNCIQKDTCSDKGGQICPTNNMCYGTVDITTDTNKCCIGTCKVCTSSDCPSTMKCGNDELGRVTCVFKTCSDLGGNVCKDGETCNGEIVSADIYGNNSHVNKCCIGICNSSANTNTCTPGCLSIEKCIDGDCVHKNCSDIGGVICGEEQKCIGGSFIFYYNTLYCCFNASQQTSCQDPVSCSTDTDCNDNNPNTYDYCYITTHGICVNINDLISNFDIQKSREKAVDSSQLIEFCSESSIINANPFVTGYINYTQEKLDSSQQIKPCSASNEWGLCKKWWLECVYNNQRMVEEILVKKIPGQDEYKLVISGAPWNVSIS